MSYSRVYLDGNEYVREEDGKVVERREATDVESAEPPPVDQDPVVEIIQTILGQLFNALDVNRTFLNISSPTAAMNAAQVKSLTRQMNGLIRLVLNQYDSSD